MPEPVETTAADPAMQPVEYVLDGIHLTLIGCWLYLAAAATGWFPSPSLFRPLVPQPGDPSPVLLYVLAVVVVADYPLLWLQLRRMAQAQADKGGLPLTTRIVMRAAYAAAPVIYFLLYLYIVHS